MFASIPTAAITDGGTLAPFDPEASKRRDAQTTAVIEYARRVKDWPLLDRAVEEKIEDQEEFVAWWRDTVRRPGGDQKSGEPDHYCSTATMILSVSDAEEHTGITKQQVSMWRKRLEDKDAYRKRLYGVAWRQAMGVALRDGRVVRQGEFAGRHEQRRGLSA